MSLSVIIGVYICRSSHQRCPLKKGAPSNFTKFTGKNPCQSLFFNKVATLLKKRFCHRCFPVNFAKFLRTAFLQNTSDWLLLHLSRNSPLNLAKDSFNLNQREFYWILMTGSGPPHTVSHWGGIFFKKGQLQASLKQLNFEQKQNAY